MVSEPEACAVLPVDRAILTFLEERGTAGREGKTIAWHRVALRSLQEYLVRHDLGFLEAITHVMRNEME